jgi:hypothetical protein
MDKSEFYPRFIQILSRINLEFNPGLLIRTAGHIYRPCRENHDCRHVASQRSKIADTHILRRNQINFPKSSDRYQW